MKTQSDLFLRSCHRVIVAGLLALAIMLAPGCASDPTVDGAQQFGGSYNYRNGWYHRANGQQSIREIAAIYLRDPALTSELNRTGPDTIPVENAAIYIPPVHDRGMLRQILTEINADPSLVPMNAPAVEDFRTADQMLQEIRQPQPIVEPAPVVVATPFPPEPTPASTPTTPVVTPAPTPASLLGQPTQPTVSQPVEAQPAAAQPTQAWSDPATAQPASSDPNAIPLQAAPVPTKVFSLEQAQANYDAVLEATKAVKAQAGQFNWPIQGKIIRPFSTTGADPFPGIAIEAPEGAPIYASREGKVVFAGVLEGYGNVVIIEHTGRETSVYGYASSILVKVNRQVIAGEQIALVGRPTATSPSQLYFQIRKNARPVNPLEYLK